MLALSSSHWTGRRGTHRCLESTGDLTASRVRKTHSSVLTKGSTREEDKYCENAERTRFDRGGDDDASDTDSCIRWFRCPRE